jgi:hypothetical protein
MERTRHTNWQFVGQVVCAKPNHLLGCITFENAGLRLILVTTIVLQYSHVPLERVHVVEKHMTNIMYLIHNMYMRWTMISEIEEGKTCLAGI